MCIAKNSEKYLLKMGYYLFGYHFKGFENNAEIPSLLQKYPSLLSWGGAVPKPGPDGGTRGGLPPIPPAEGGTPYPLG